jgi:hypothetical protein
VRRSGKFLAASALAGALLLWPAAPSAAQDPDHLHLDVSTDGCRQVQVSGHRLPASTRLTLRYSDARSGRVLGTDSVRSRADGRLVASATLPLAEVGTLRVSAVRPGAAAALVFGETSVAGRCRLPFTGLPPDLARLAAALAAVVLGAGLLAATTPRGRHVRR